jgi:hypothetical protein
MEVGSFLNSRDLRVSTTQLCLKGAQFVARPITARNEKLSIWLENLISCTTSSSTRPAPKYRSAQSVAQEAAQRIEFCLARRPNLTKICVHQKGVRTKNNRVHAELYRHFQHAAQVQPNKNEAITVEWKVSEASVTYLAGLIELGSVTADDNSSESTGHPRYRLQLC